MRFNSKPPLAFRLALFALASAIPTVARADISFVDQFRSQYNTQTGDGAAVTTNGYSFSTRLYASASGLYSNVAMTSPGGLRTLVAEAGNPAVYDYVTPLYSTQAQMDAAFPAGTGYTYSATGAGGSATTTLTSGIVDYPLSTPYLSGTTYSSLQGMNAAQDFQFTFSPFVTGAAATESDVFFTIRDDTLGQIVYDAGLRPATTTGLTLAGGTLQAGHSYTYELIFSNRNLVQTPNTTFLAQLGFDYRTSGTFTARAAAVPEPSSIVLAGLGSAVLIARLARRRARAA